MRFTDELRTSLANILDNTTPSSDLPDFIGGVLEHYIDHHPVLRPAYNNMQDISVTVNTGIVTITLPATASREFTYQVGCDTTDTLSLADTILFGLAAAGKAL